MFYKKNETAIIDIAKKYLSGTYTFEEFVNILSSNKKAFNYLRKYSKNKLFFILPDLEKFRNIENTYWIRHNYYNLMYSYLYFLKINVDSFCEEYAIYRKLDKVLPEWFQLDVFLLYEMFPKLDELIEENKLVFELEKICKTQDGVFPIWLQNPEWPVIDNTPLKFIGQTIDPNSYDYDGQEIEYYFLDETTNEKTTIVQLD